VEKQLSARKGVAFRRPSPLSDHVEDTLNIKPKAMGGGGASRPPTSQTYYIQMQGDAPVAVPV
jgi:hypothetical protein